MKSRIEHDNPLTKRARAWKRKQAIISLPIEEMAKKIGDKDAIFEQKVDGQSVIMDYKNGSAKFATLDGRIIEDIPVLDEIASILKKHNVSNAQMMGELAAMEDGRILGFNESMSIIRNPKSDKNKISWHPYEILNINGKEIPEDLESCRKSLNILVDYFKGSKHIRPVDFKQGKKTELMSMWDRLVMKEGNEGLIIRTADGKVYKSKPKFTYDLVVIAVGDKTGKNWPKKLIGTTLMAFMDRNHVFRTAGEVGTGWTRAERAELFTWAQKNKVDEDNHYVWVKPSKIMEVQWERSHIKDMKAYKYSKGKYEPIGKLQSGSIVKPRFIRWRTDKSVTPSDLRLTQIPGWKEREKMAQRIAYRWACHPYEDYGKEAHKEKFVGIFKERKEKYNLQDWPVKNPKRILWKKMALKIASRFLQAGLSGSEALYGFCGWLTTRDDETIMSDHDDAGHIADLVDTFCKTNDLPSPREGWEKNLKHPKMATIKNSFISHQISEKTSSKVKTNITKGYNSYGSQWTSLRKIKNLEVKERGNKWFDDSDLDLDKTKAIWVTEDPRDAVLYNLPAEFKNVLDDYPSLPEKMPKGINLNEDEYRNYRNTFLHARENVTEVDLTGAEPVIENDETFKKAFLFIKPVKR